MPRKAITAGLPLPKPLLPVPKPFFLPFDSPDGLPSCGPEASGKMRKTKRKDVVMCEAGVSKRTPACPLTREERVDTEVLVAGPAGARGRRRRAHGRPRAAAEIYHQSTTTTPGHPSAPRGGVARPDRPSPIMRSVLARRVRSCGQPVADGARSDTAVLPRGFLAGQSRPLGPAVRLWMCLS